MKKKEQQIASEKPEPFFAFGSQEDVTEAEIENRKIRMERAEQIGECFTKVTEEEWVNPYKIQALALIAEDKPIPEELLKQIEEFEKDRLSKEKI